MLKSSLCCDYRDEYMIAKGTIFIAPEAGANPNSKDKKGLLRNCALFNDYLCEINNTQIDNAQEIGAVMSMCNLIEYRYNYSKTSGSLWQYYRDEPFLDANSAIASFPAGNESSASSIVVVVQKMLKYWCH